jgi:hypothetical protein
MVICRNSIAQYFSRNETTVVVFGVFGFKIRFYCISSTIMMVKTSHSFSAVLFGSHIAPLNENNV